MFSCTLGHSEVTLSCRGAQKGTLMTENPYNILTFERLERVVCVLANI